ncbi:MAG: ABC transporter permease [Bacteroidia bacterium]|nr:ABC transporter permease [Bacteroidia bacterium]
MHKVWTIIEREYLTRVKSKAFILSTLLMPVLLGALVLIPILSATHVGEQKLTVYVLDQTEGIGEELKSGDGITFLPALYDEQIQKDSLKPGEALLIIPKIFENLSGRNTAPLAANEKLSLGLKRSLTDRLKEGTRRFRMKRLGISREDFELLNVGAEIDETTVGAEEQLSAEVASMVGYVMSMLIYFMLVFYGMFVMRGVIEEKANRIVEVMASSVKPFQLMMGKVIGIGAAGLTQFIAWILLFLGISTAVSLIFGGGGASVSGADMAQARDQVEMIQQALQAFNLKMILLFLFYFLGGYLLYGSLFAAVGSAVDQETDAQQFTWPVVMPLIIPMLVLANIIQNPNGPLSVFMSHFPLFSSNVMMIRYTATDVPAWELAVSMLLLIGGFLGATWVAARVYRVGILMYGKKPSFAELFKWIFRS